ncbi:hypothetical protein COOONC_06729 [Cooperia oncophora]
MKMKFCSLAFLLLLVIAQIEARIPDEHRLRALHRHRPVPLKRIPASYSHTHLHRTRFKRGQEPLEGVDGVEMVQKQGVDGVEMVQKQGVDGVEMVQKQEVTELEQNIQTGPTNEQFSMDVPQDGIMTRKITYEMQPRVRLVRRTINVVPQTERVIKRTRIKMRYDSGWEQFEMSSTFTRPSFFNKLHLTPKTRKLAKL